MPCNKFSIVLLLICIFLVIGLYFRPVCEKKENSVIFPESPIQGDDSEKIAEMFRRGLRIDAKNNPDLRDADAFGAVLTQIALERFAECPSAAAKFKSVFASHVENSPPLSRYMQWNIFLEYLDRSLNHCSDADALRTVWHTRSAVVEEQNKILLAAITDVGQTLDSMENKIVTKDIAESVFLENLTPEEGIRDVADFLFNDIDSSPQTSGQIKVKIQELRTKAAKIASKV